MAVKSSISFRITVAGAPLAPIGGEDWTVEYFLLDDTGATSFPGKSKHSRWAYDPDTQRHYNMGGDFSTPGIATENLNMTQYSLHVPTMDWNVERPYHGDEGDTLPQHPDQITWLYHPPTGKIQIFGGWFSPTVPINVGWDTHPNRTLIGNHYMSWDIDTKNFTDEGNTNFNHLVAGAGQESSRGLYDPETNNVVFFHGAPRVIHLDADTKAVQVFNINTISPNCGFTAAIKVPGERRCVVLAFARGGGTTVNDPYFVLEYNLDTHTVVHRGRLSWEVYNDHIPAYIPELRSMLCFSQDILDSAGDFVDVIAAQHPTDSWLINVDTFQIRPGPPKPRTNPETHKFAPKYLFYDPPTKTVIGWSTASFGYTTDVNRIYRYTPPARPSWMSGRDVLEWFQIPNTTLFGDADTTASHAAGLLPPTDQNVDFTSMRNIFGFSGAAMKSEEGWMFFFGSGGALGWEGNNIPRVDLSKDVPEWIDWVTPSHGREVWKQNRVHISGPYIGQSDDDDYVALPFEDRAYFRNQFGAPYRPHTPHAYRQLHYMNHYDELVTIGRANPVINDFDKWNVVDRVRDSVRDWERRPYPDSPGLVGDDIAICTDHRNDDVYRCYATGIAKFSRATQTWTTFHTDTSWSTTALGPAAVNPLTNELVRFSAFPHDTHVSGKPLQAYALATGVRTGCDILGPAWAALDAEEIASFGTGQRSYNRKASPMIWCPDLQCLVFYSYNGTLYRLDKTSSTAYTLSVLTTTGIPPAANLAQTNPAGAGSTNGIWTRMQYSNKLGGIVIAISTIYDFWFLKTR